mgnify:CR=1 FL=1
MIFSAEMMPNGFESCKSASRNQTGLAESSSLVPD